MGEERLSQILVEKINPISKEILKLINDKNYLDSILLEGNKKANVIASQKVKKMQEIIGFWPNFLNKFNFLNNWLYSNYVCSNWNNT